MSAIDPNTCLPKELTVESVDDILYRIGLCLTSVRDRPKRRLIDHPVVVFVFMTLFLTLRLSTITLDDDNELIFKVVGDPGHVIGVRREFGLYVILASVLALSSQLIYYNNYRNGVKPTFLRVFQMMSGLVPPKSLGLTDEKEIGIVVEKTRKLKSIVEFQINFVSCMAFAYFPACYLAQGQFYDGLIYGLPYVVASTLWVYYFWNIFLFQFVCFYLICLYLKIKINSLNESLLEMKRRKRFIRIRETLQSFDSLYSEINEYNTTFWSKFLAVFWLTFGLVIILLLYVTIFVSFSSIIKFMFIDCLIFIVISFLFLIFTASSVNYCANKSYKTLNSLIISYSKHNKHFHYTRIVTNLKVSQTL